MKKDVRTLPNAQFDDFTFTLKMLKADLRSAESDLSFELTMIVLEQLIEMVESLEWP